MKGRPSEPSDPGSGSKVVKAAWWEWLLLCLRYLIPCLTSLAMLFFTEEARDVLGIPKEASIRLWSLCFVGLITLGLLNCLIQWLGGRHDCSKAQLRAELTEAQGQIELFGVNAKSLCEGALRDLARGPLGFEDGEGNTDRISLYVHDSEKHFQLVARYSENPTYLEQGRSRYPASQGCIGKGWTETWDFRLLPDPVQHYDAWEKECHSLGVSKTTCRSLKMKSSLYCCCALRNGDRQAPDGVLVIESTRSNRYTEADLQTVLTQEQRGYLARLLQTLRPWLGDRGTARREGF